MTIVPTDIHFCRTYIPTTVGDLVVEARRNDAILYLSGESAPLSIS